MNQHNTVPSPVRRHATFVGLCLALFATAPAQVVPHQGKTPPKLILEAGEHRLEELIDQSARYLKRNYLYSKQELAQVETFTLQAGVAMDAASCEDFVSQIAYSKGFAMISVNRSLRVFEFINMRGQHRARAYNEAAVMTPAQVRQNAGRYLVVTTAVTFKHLDASRASSQLRPFFAMSGGRGAPLNFVAVSQDSLLICGFAPQVARAMGLLELVDLPARERKADPRQQAPQRRRSAK